MAWRGLHISRASRLTLSHRQLVVTQGVDETQIALEDLAWVVLDTPEATVTSALLSACMEAGVAMIFSDPRHMPSGVLLPFHRHHRQAGIARAQLDASSALYNWLWRALVRAKIENQAAVLASLGSSAQRLRALAARVGPADPENIEAQAARFYWQKLFSGFARDAEDDRRNAMLNYAYAVLRGGVARALVAAGLLPAIGVHHASALNPFNLADDVLEPFRPVADALVYRLSASGNQNTGALSIEDRRALAAVLLEPVDLGGETVTALVATETVAQGLVRAFEAGSAKDWILPRMP